jgi:hypothetical protein
MLILFGLFDTTGSSTPSGRSVQSLTVSRNRILCLSELSLEGAPGGVIPWPKRALFFDLCLDGVCDPRMWPERGRLLDSPSLEFEFFRDCVRRWR